MYFDKILVSYLNFALSNFAFYKQKVHKTFGFSISILIFLMCDVLEYIYIIIIYD